MEGQLLKEISEREFQAQILELAKYTGWKSVHFRAARTEKGWRTAVSGDGVGWPDVTLVRPPRMLMLEVKAERGRLSAAQEDWLRLLRQVPGVEVHVVRPRDLPMVEDLLR